MLKKITHFLLIQLFLLSAIIPISIDAQIVPKDKNNNNNRNKIFKVKTQFISLLDNSTYDFIENLASSGLISLDFIGVRPFRSDIIYKKLLKIKNHDKDTQIVNFIDKFERKYIDKKTDKTIGSYRFVNIQSENSFAWGDPYLNQSIVKQVQTNDSNDILANTSEVGFKAFINYRNFFSIYTNTSVKIIHEGISLRDEFANPLVFTHDVNEFNSEDYTETYFMFYDDNMDLSIGKFPITEGAGYLNSLTLSEQYSYFESMHFNYRLDRFKFSTISGFLIADSETRSEYMDSTITNGQFIESDRKNRRSKYLASHRLEWRIIDNLNVGINENVIYGDRPLELGYLFPVLPVFWMEHYYGDLDNATMSFDVYYRPYKNFSLYSELFVDDETFTKSFTKYYGNKWAILAGVYNSNFLTIPHLNFRFEYSRIEPYVYTHKFHVNRYMNVDSYLGGEFGPDSEHFNFKLDYFFSNNADTYFSLGFKRASVGEPIPGKEDEPLYHEDIKTFLRGTVEKHYYYSVDVNWAYNDYLMLNLFYSHTDILNKKHIHGNVYSNNTIALSLKVRFMNYFLLVM